MLVLSNSLARRRRSAHGSVLVISLLLVLIGTFGMTAWFGLIAARSLEVNAMEDATRRRVRLNSVKEVARQAGSELFLAMDGGKASITRITMPDGSGAVTFPAWTATPYTESGTTRYNQVGGVPSQSFSTDLTATLNDGGGTIGAVDYSVQLRTYVPALRGDLLTIHEPEVAATPVTTDAGLLVNGRTVVWDPSNALAHRTERLYASGKASTLALLTLAGDKVIPDNEAFAPRSTGGTFTGQLQAISTSESEANRYTNRLAGLSYVTIPQGAVMGDLIVDGYHADGTDVTINFQHPSLPHLYIETQVSLHFNGQINSADYAAAGLLAARLIVIADPAGGGVVTDLDIKVIGENNRPVVVALSRADRANTCNFRYIWDSSSPFAFPRWRMLLELENSTFKFWPEEHGVSEIHLVGGIRTDASIDTTLLPVRVLRDSSSPFIEAIASRAGYVEIMRN